VSQDRDEWQFIIFITRCNIRPVLLPFRYSFNWEALSFPRWTVCNSSTYTVINTSTMFIWFTAMNFCVQEKVRVESGGQWRGQPPPSPACRVGAQGKRPSLRLSQRHLLQNQRFDFPRISYYQHGTTECLLQRCPRLAVWG
jgi:hypothetical protein